MAKRTTIGNFEPPHVWDWITLAVGVGLIYLGTAPNWVGQYPSLLPAKFVGEVGVSLLIAGIVTIAYEAQARRRAARETVEDVLSKVMGDLVNPGIWREMRQQLLNKVVVRKATVVRFRLHRPEGMESGRCVLNVSIEYCLTSLRSNEQEVPILHFVDKFMHDPQLNLPKLLRIEIAGERQPLPDQHRFKTTLIVPGRDSPGLRVLVERDEIIYVPGAYNLLMSELTELEQIALHDSPSNVRVTVNAFFDERPLTVDKAIVLGRFLLPGQSVEVRFEPSE